MKLRTISTRAHGIMDLAVAPMLPMIPRLLGCSRIVKRLFDSTAVVASASTVCTDFEVGLVKELPVKAHLALDASTGAVLLGAAAICRDKTRDRAALAVAGLYFLATSLMTKTLSTDEKQRRARKQQHAMAQHRVDTPMEEFSRDTGPMAAMPGATR